MKSKNPEIAETTRWLEEHWALSSDVQRQCYAFILACRVDQFLLITNKYYEQLRAAVDTEQAQAALVTFHHSANESAHSSNLDLLSASGAYVPDEKDQRRLEFYKVACLSNKTATRQ